MRTPLLTLIIMAIVAGCAHSTPLVPAMAGGSGPDVAATTPNTSSIGDGPHRLWGEYT